MKLSIINIAKNIKYFLINIFYYPLYRILYRKKYKILSDSEVIDRIIKHKLSIARYGDGEFKWMFGLKQNSFQENNKILQKRLNEIINSNNKNIIIGIPNMINTLSKLNIQAKGYWSKFLVRNYKKIKGVLNLNNTYCNTNITRPYIDYKNKSKKLMKKKFDLLKNIWNHRNILIVEGEFSKLGINNDLFSNAKSIRRIICPAKNAFNKYDIILHRIVNTVKKDDLVLISLGPTATVLAYDLSKKNIQSIDLGHTDVEYSWYLLNAKYKIPIKNKFVNEAQSKNMELTYNEEYEKQIIDKVL